MVENELTAAIRDYISEAIDDIRLPNRIGALVAPQVLNGYLPPKRGTATDDFPFVLVRPDKGSTDLEQTTVDVSIVIGCYAETFDGHEYCLNVMSRIREALCTMPNWTLAHKYQLRHPITWENFDEQPYPQWQLNVNTKWAMKAPSVVF